MTTKWAVLELTMNKSRNFIPKLSQTLAIVLVAILTLVVGSISVSALPESCQDIRDADPTAADGVYTIYPNGNTQVFDVYCNDMAGTPNEYLELQNIGGSYNYAQYTAGGASPGPNVKTSYQKIRLDPATLMVDIGDQTFATSTGSLWHSSVTRVYTYLVNSMPYGVAYDCKSSWSNTGVANIDLSGTPFAVIDPFSLSGHNPAGTSIFSQNNQIVNLNGGGYCGGITPSPGMSIPFNTEGGYRLDLEYIGPRVDNIPATIDVNPNTFNLKSNGEWITAYIELPDGSDLNNINVSKIKLTNATGEIISSIDSSAPSSISDYDFDGIPDLMVKFDENTLATYLEENFVMEEETQINHFVELKVTGELEVGIPFKGSDTIRVIKKGK